MNRVVLPFLIIISYLYIGCNVYCSGTQLSVDICYASGGDTLSIYADSTLIATKSFPHGRVNSLRDKRNKVAEICATKDSLLISIFYSSKDTSKHILLKDTSFYIHPKELKGLSVGVSLRYEIYLYLDKVKGGYGDNEPDM
jgi:hypothetical protein